MILTGCGNFTEPPVSTSSDTDLHQKTEEESASPKNSSSQEDENITVTHIRVLEFDPTSKIPEYLVKLPIYQEQK